MVADALSGPNSGTAVAGAASCCAAIADRAPFDLQDMALRQILCTQVQNLLSSKELCIVKQKVGALDLLGDATTGMFRPLVLRDLRRQIFDHPHGAAQPGMRATCRLIGSRYV
jgi:hypothetical protein